MTEYTNVVLKEKYPCIAVIEEMFSSFHAIIMGNDPDKPNPYIENYKETEISRFCHGLKKDMLKETTTNSNFSNVLYTKEPNSVLVSADKQYTSQHE